MIKEVTEEIAIALNKFCALREWAEVSFARVILVVSVLGGILVGGQYVYVNYLLSEAKKAGENRSREINSLGKEHGYKAALDAINACLESAKEEPTLNVWYCKQAVAKYRSTSTNWPQDRVKEVIDKHAYLAMSDVSHYIRTVELDRLISTPRSREEEVLTLLLSKTVTTLWVFIVVAATTGPYLFFWVLPNRRRAAPDPQPADPPQ
jgi:hypothetical protein